MPSAPKHPDEDKRIAALCALEIIDTPPEADFDDIVQLCSEICEVPISLITLVDEDRQWFKAKVGISLSETPREVSFCAFCILQDGIFEIEDARLDPRVADNPVVTGEPYIRFYAGCPITSKSGYQLGSLCVVDTEPKVLNECQRNALRVLAKQVSNQLELRQMNHSLREANKKSEQRRESLKEMIRLIAHDLRNSLGGLTSMVDLLTQELPEMQEKEIMDYLGTMNASGLQVFALLENLLEWSSSEAEMIEYDPELVYLSELIAQVMEIVTPLAHSKKLEIAVEAPKDLLIRLDKRMIASVLRNLLTNAFKFSKKAGRVELTVQPTTDGAHIEVRDYGVGMEPKQVARLKQKVPLQSTYGTAGEKGTGIGLNLVHAFLEEHGSHLVVDSSPDAGTCFGFSLTGRA